MKKLNILLVEDDAKLRAGLIDILEGEAYEVIPAKSGEEALLLFGQRRIDLVLLDRMLPEISGDEVCCRIRMKSEIVPIIILSAKSEQEDKVNGLEYGADDYITKPFGVPELMARIYAALRRARSMAATAPKQQITAPMRFSFGPAEIDAGQQQSKVGENIYDISARELKLLQVFYSSPNRALGREELLFAAWGTEYLGTTRTLDQHIAQLRKKIEPDPANPVTLVSVHGVGYKFVKGGEAALAQGEGTGPSQKRG